MKKSTLVALIVFAALAAAAIWRAARRPERGIDRMSLAAADVKAVDRVELSGKASLELRREGERWRSAAAKPADADAVKALLEAIPKIESSDLITRAADRFADLEVDDAKGTRVRATAAGKIVAEFVAGKAQGDGMAVRVGDAAWHVPRLYPYVFARERSAWLDRRLLRDDASAVTRVEVRRAGAPAFALVKAGADWAAADPAALPAGFRFDKNLAAGWISTLLFAQAQEVLDTNPPPETTKLDDAADRIALDVADQADGGTPGGRREIVLGATLADKSVYARVAGRDDVFTVPEHVAREMRKGVTDFRDLTLMAFDRTKVEALTVADGKAKIVFERLGTSWKIASSSEPVPKDFDFDAGAVDRRVGMLAASRAIGVAAVTPAEAGLGAAQASLVARLGDKKTATLAFGKEHKHEAVDASYARGNADGEVYVVSKQLRSNLTAGLDSFKRRAAPQMPGGIDPASLSKLPPEVREALLRQMAQQPQ